MIIKKNLTFLMKACRIDVLSHRVLRKFSMSPAEWAKTEYGLHFQIRANLDPVQEIII